MISNFTSAIDRVRSVAPASRWSVVKSAATRRSKLRVKAVRRRLVTGQVRAVQLALGPRKANNYFWIAPSGDLSLFNVQRRIDMLVEHHPDDVDHFVLECIERTPDPVTIAALARHPHAAEVIREWLNDHLDGGSDELVARLQGNRLLGGAVAGAARVLLDPERAEGVVTWITDVYQIPDSRMFQFMDSMGWRPGGTSGELSGSAPTATSEHRLIVAESFNDPHAIAPLLHGAKRATLVATAETFGRADFSSYAEWPGVGEIAVEHIRSRVTRFSQDYIDLHEATASLATAVTEAVGSLPGLLDPDDAPVLAVEVADFLFFQALKHRALDELIDDDRFDHVVLALGEQQGSSEFLSLISRVDGLLDDPRLEIISVSRSAAVRSKFWEVLEELQHPTPPGRSVASCVSDELVMRKFDEDTQRLAAGLGDFPAGERPQICLVTANNGAYNDSTAGYIHELRQDLDIRIVQIGSGVGPLLGHLEAVGADDDIPLDHFAPASARFRPLADLILDSACFADLPLVQPSSRAEFAARAALSSSLPRLTRKTIAPSLGRLRALDHWMRSLAAKDALPDAIVLSPQRNVPVGGVAFAARRHGIPTVILEPHAQDASYSRYIKIASDYYGVMSDYFKVQAAQGFAIDTARIETVGSPRQVAPSDYDRAEARRAARATYGAENGVRFDDDVTYLAFFCQPSDWTHVATVWADVLEAARRTNSVVLLKTHPEESISRTAHYLELADEHGVADRVVLLEGDAATAIDLSDIVLTAYSAAGIDAALRQTPVVCVTVGDLRYPVDLPAIVDASLTRSATELAELVSSFQSDPTQLMSRAQSLLERESQFVEGPGPRARALVARAIASGSDGIRARSDIPSSLFLDGPHPTFPV